MRCHLYHTTRLSLATMLGSSIASVFSNLLKVADYPPPPQYGYQSTSTHRFPYSIPAFDVKLVKVVSFLSTRRRTIAQGPLLLLHVPVTASGSKFLDTFRDQVS